MVYRNEEDMEIINLSGISGFPILLDKQKMDLIFESKFLPVEKSKRRLDDLRPYLKDPAAAGPDPVYRMWRDIQLKTDKKNTGISEMRFDITIVAAGKIGEEFIKTAGHYHLPYPEVYKTLLGQAHIFLQSYDKSFRDINSVYLVEIGTGEQFTIPINYGHNIINFSGEPLVMANWVNRKAVNDYSMYKTNRGACYYFLDNKNLIDIVKNPAYNSVPELKKIRAQKN